MPRVLTNSTGLRAADEVSPGVLSGSPSWFGVEFDSLDGFGAELTTTPRRPISPTRGRKKGTPTDSDSAVEFGTDLTMEAADRFSEAFMFAEWANREFKFNAPPATGTGYTIPAASALLAGKLLQSAAASTLFWAKGYVQPANNGLKLLTAAVAPAAVLLTVSGLTAETPPANASLQVAGLRTNNDLQLTIALDGTGSVTSSAGAVSWAARGLRPGMFVHLGGTTNALVGTNRFVIAATQVSGMVRVVTVSGLVFTFDKASAGLLVAGAGTSTAPGTAGNVDVLFGRFARNLPNESNTDDARYLEKTTQFEASFPTLGAGGTPRYEYAPGNFANELAIEVPLTGKVTASFGFIGLASEPITSVRKTNAAAAVAPLRTTAVSSAIDVVLTSSLVSAVSETCFKSSTISLVNNVSAEKCVGTLGARFVNAGIFELNVEGQMLFTTEDMVNAVRENRTVSYTATMKNDDGAMVVDAPEMTVGGGDREYPVDESVLVNLTFASHTSAVFGFDASISLLPVVPLS